MAPAPTPPAVQLTDILFDWPGRVRFSLRIDRFTVAQGEKVLLLGSSGSGKSTLLSLICGIAVPQRGRVDVGGAPLNTLSAPARDRFRADRIGVIFQMFNLLPYATPLENILLPLSFARARRRAIADPRDDALRLTRALGLADDLVIRARAQTLSIGQQQRVAVARALIGAPPLIVADEPTSALDAASQEAFLQTLTAQTDVAGASLLMVSHDERLAQRFDRVVDLADIAHAKDGQTA